MTSIALHAGDNRVSLRRLIDQGVHVHAIVTDPPYGLTSVVKRFGKKGAAAAGFGSDGAFARASAGFMGKQWDGTGIERDPEFWRLCYDILLPGGMVFAFSGSRTGHWQACAMEMAGFVMHPMHIWAFGSGMPKAHNPVLEIDRLMGVESEVVGHVRRRDIRNGQGEARGANAMNSNMREDGPVYIDHPVRAATSPEAKQWDGWRYGTQTQKPALEPIYLGQKPFSEKTGAKNLLKHGVGAFNIEGCRVETEGSDDDRWPANLLHDGSADVVAMFPTAPGQLAKASASTNPRVDQNVYERGTQGSNGAEPRGDTGSAARFFGSFRYICDDCQDEGVVTEWCENFPVGYSTCPTCDGRSANLPQIDPVFYQAKAGKADRAGSKHPTVKPIALMRYLIRHICPPGGVVLDPFAGSGTTAEAARREGMDCMMMEAETEYVDFLRQRFGLPGGYAADLADLLGEADDLAALLS